MRAMGLLDMLGIGGTPERQIERHLKKLKQVYAQSDYRRGAAEALLSMGTPEAYFALCKRFSVVCNSAYWDEEEKHWLVDTFVEIGAPGVDALKRFVNEVDHVNFPIRALERLLNAADMTAFLIDTLQSRSTEDYRRDRGKLEIIDHIGQRDPDAELLDAILPYLHDHSDDVICKTIEVLEDWQHQDVGPPFFELMYKDTMSARVQRRAAQAIVTLGFESAEDLAELPEAVAEDYLVEGRALRSNRPDGSEA